MAAPAVSWRLILPLSEVMAAPPRQTCLFRASLLLLLLLSIPCARIARRAHQARAEQAAVRALAAKGVVAWYDFEVTDDGGIYFDGDGAALSPPEPQWFRDALSVETLRPVTRLGATPDCGLTDTDLRQLRALPNLEILILRCPTISDDGLRQLLQLKKLRDLDLFRTPVTDDGLTHLQELSQLKHLRLEDTRVTEDGLRRIKSALPDCELEYNSPLTMNAR